MSELQIVLPSLRRRSFTTGLFDSKLNGFLTLACLAIAVWMFMPLWRWAVNDAVWTGLGPDCGVDGAGACWAFIRAKFRFIIFGFYPPALQWRPSLVILGIAILLFVSSRPQSWSRWLLLLWFLAIPLCWLLMAGTLLPPKVPTNQWGGLPITLLVSLIGLATAFPIALLLALARRSEMRIFRVLAVVFIECLRGVPLIAVLYVAMLVVPMALPADALTDKLLRAQVGITLFVSAYLAEVIRAGLQSIPAGQTEAAYSLGLAYWQTLQLVLLPQALRTVIPAIVNLSIGILLNTSLLAVIGISDLLNAAKMAATDPNWLGFYTESFVFAGCIYFAISFGASRYSIWLERRLRARK
ncbi:amino acid ABC transporter permease (plasmid) [Rhizobium sp. CB3171]|uniref:amino acid ABC transporter permease n=1 Tax=Rhizobium sp. CB3171 TaxID=3039157 RepID=UPI0024B1F536|nr:amino acid ABC transporter permease [Rhizobium sp. CB3171]WFU05187.1 amino acid ABC transporter permease [Rhizobium sp. CB3171]